MMPKGPQGQKRPADVIGNAAKVMRVATGEETDDTDWRPPRTWQFGSVRDSIHRVRDGGGGCGVKLDFLMLRSG
jgi:hypothetical protein